MSLRRKAMEGIVWSAVQTWGRQVLAFVVFLILSRLLEPEAFGLVAMATVFVAFARVFLDQGFTGAIIQRAELERAHLDTAFWVALLTGGLLTLVGILASGLVATLFREPDLTPIVTWLSLDFTLTALSSTQQAILRRELAFKELALRSNLSTVMGGIAGVTLALRGYGVWSLVGQNLVSSVVGAIVLWGVSDWRPSLNFSRRHFRDLFSFGINLMGINLLGFLNGRADDFLIGYFLGSTALGYYTVAYRLLRVMTKLLTGVTSAVAFPTFSRLQSNPKRMRNALYSAVRYTSLIAFPAFVGVSVVAPGLVRVLYGTKWAPSIPAMQILALIGVLHAVYYFSGSIITAAGKPSWRLAISLLGTTVNVVGFAIAVRWGIVAVAAALVVSGYLVAPIELWVVRRLIGIDVRTYLGQAAVPFLGTLAMVAVLLTLKYTFGQELGLRVQVVVYVLAGIVTYLAAVHLMARSLLAELRDLFILILPDWEYKGA